MSDQSWMDEFYPVQASTFKGSKDLAGATKHSLRAWRGRLKESLERHGLHNGSPISTKASNCALCAACSAPRSCIPCKTCPVVLCGGFACDGLDSAWRKRHLDRGVEGMVAQLEKALEYVETLEKDKQV